MKQQAPKISIPGIVLNEIGHSLGVAAKMGPMRFFIALCFALTLACSRDEKSKSPSQKSPTPSVNTQAPHFSLGLLSQGRLSLISGEMTLEEKDIVVSEFANALEKKYILREVNKERFGIDLAREVRALPFASMTAQELHTSLAEIVSRGHDLHLHYYGPKKRLCHKVTIGFEIDAVTKDIGRDDLEFYVTSTAKTGVHEYDVAMDGVLPGFKVLSIDEGPLFDENSRRVDRRSKFASGWSGFSLPKEDFARIRFASLSGAVLERRVPWLLVRDDVCLAERDALPQFRKFLFENSQRIPNWGLERATEVQSTECDDVRFREYKDESQSSTIYFKLRTFNSVCRGGIVGSMEKVLRSFPQTTPVILDLRGNTGGNILNSISIVTDLRGSSMSTSFISESILAVSNDEGRMLDPFFRVPVFRSSFFVPVAPIFPGAQRKGAVIVDSTTSSAAEITSLLLQKHANFKVWGEDSSTAGAGSNLDCVKNRSTSIGNIFFTTKERLPQDTFFCVPSGGYEFDGISTDEAITNKGVSIDRRFYSTFSDKISGERNLIVEISKSLH